MDWDKIRIFHIVAKAGSLTHAGYALNLSQSSVSRQISTLEKELNVLLFVRHARGLILTEQGEVLFKTTRSVFAQLGAASSILNETRDGLSGVLKVATSVAFGSVWLATRLPIFMQLYPDIKLELILTDVDVDFTLREADLSISFNRQLVDYEIIQRDLFKFTLGIYGSTGYLEKHGTPTVVEDLSNHNLIVFGDYATPPVDNVNWLLRLGTKPGDIRIPSLSMNNAFGIVQSVKNGLGIASVADFIARDYKELVPILLQVPKPEIQAKFMYPKQLRNSKRIDAFYKFIAEELKKN